MRLGGSPRNCRVSMSSLVFRQAAVLSGPLRSARWWPVDAEFQGSKMRWFLGVGVATAVDDDCGGLAVCGRGFMVQCFGGQSRSSVHAVAVVFS